ncbi:MAG: D-sedoheptulose 7-phosphate isomerase [Thiohalocapsa sp.]|nr:D-sedoheptulose 7-phosphate isomerase [Thiohalocapsa sp.]MCF7991033.1 D-sedoheptulose 7-phosphate isomerase [Thiohalocapsa sp.]
MQRSIGDVLTEHIAVIRGLDALVPDIERLADRCHASLAAGGRVFWMGNGGSAADSQHLAAELVGRFERERPGLASIALTTDSSILTSVANDYGFEAVFARQVEALCRPGDVLVGLSTSGNSPNVLLAMQTAESLGVFRAGMTGEGGGKLAAQCELCLRVPSRSTARVQEAHIVVGHLLCDLVEARVAGLAAD